MFKILSVDDQPDNRYLLEVILRAAGYEVHSAENGVDALAKLEEQPFDLIVSDILMPQMDGFQLCREVKRRPDLRSIPFIFYSATYTEEEDKQLGMSLGAARFIVKPVEPEVFLAFIQEVVKSCETGEMHTSAPPDETEEDYLTAYNKRLINKLENKISELEVASRELDAALCAKEQEIAERILTEAALRESEARFRALFEQAAVGVTVVDAVTGRFLHVNERFSELVGYTSPELETLTFQAITHPEDLDNDLQLLKSLKTRKIPDYTMEKRYVRKDGSAIWVEITVSILRWTAAGLQTCITVVQNITNRKAAQAALAAQQHELEESEARFKAIFEHSPDAIFWADAESGLLIRCNGAAERLVGRSSEEIIGQHQSFLHPPLEVDAYREMFQSNAQGNRTSPLEAEVIHKDGHLIPVAISPTFIEQQGRKLLQGIFHDITTRVRAQEEVRALNASLERKVQERTFQLQSANQELEAFAYSISHDLKAPLRAIAGFSQAVIEDFSHLLPAEGQDYLKRSRDEAIRMGTLIDDLLRLSRLGQQEMSFEDVDINALALSILQSLAFMEPTRHVQWVLDPDMHVYGDPALMRVLLDNLLSNAWKFTSKTEDARIVVHKGVSEPQWDFLRIEDNGAGFDQGHADRLFTPFRRLHSSEEFPGTGIGLAIVRRIAERHGAVLRAEGCPGKGASFTLNFPVRRT